VVSHENVEVVRRIYAGLDDRLEPPPELFEPDYEFDPSEVAPDVGVLRGYEAMQDNMRAYWETFEDFHYELEAVIHADERQVVTAVRDRARMKGSEVEVTNRYFHVWAFAAGKVARVSVHTDKSRALEAAGLRD
jgi:ketosteroid isomerase-like protein